MVGPMRFRARVDEEQVVEAIRKAETASRGEIRVHIAGRPVFDAEKAAAKVFTKLGMTATEERAGVLIFVAPVSRSFAIIGDKGIHEHCGDDLWEAASAAMMAEFRRGRFTEGIIAAIEAVSKPLQEHFPRLAEEIDRNELPDKVDHD